MSHFCRSLSTKAGWAFATYNNEPMQDFGPKMGVGWVGGCYTVGVYSALYGILYSMHAQLPCLAGSEECWLMCVFVFRSIRLHWYDVDVDILGCFLMLPRSYEMVVDGLHFTRFPRLNVGVGWRIFNSTGWALRPFVTRVVSVSSKTQVGSPCSDFTNFAP